MQVAALEARYAEQVEPRAPVVASRREREATDLRATWQDPDPLLEDAWFARGETELAVQIVAIGCDPSDEVYLPEVRSHRMPIAVGVMLASVVTALLVMV
jgi:hypothetical protein